MRGGKHWAKERSAPQPLTQSIGSSLATFLANPACSVAHAKLVMIKSLLHEMGIGPRNRFDKGEEKDPLAEFMLS